MPSRSNTARVRGGWICRSVSHRGRASTTGCGSGLPTGPERRLSAPCSLRQMPRGTWAGSSRWTPWACVRTSTPPGPSKGASAVKPDHHALGRSRGGLTAKIHLVADSRCRPLAFVIAPGRAGDAPAFAQVMVRLRVPRPVGRPRGTPDVVLADKAYSSRAILLHLRGRKIRAVIPQPSDQPPTASSAAGSTDAPPSTAGPANDATPLNDASTSSSNGAASPPSSSGRPGDPKETA